MISLFRQIIVPLILPRRDKEHEALIKVPIGIMICRGDLCSCGTIPTVIYDLYLCMGRLSPYLLITVQLSDERFTKNTIEEPREFIIYLTEPNFG